MATAEMLMTAEEFGRRPDPGHPEELAPGRDGEVLTPSLSLAGDQPRPCALRQERSVRLEPVSH